MAETETKIEALEKEVNERVPTVSTLRKRMMAWREPTHLAMRRKI